MNYMLPTSPFSQPFGTDITTAINLATLVNGSVVALATRRKDAENARSFAEFTLQDAAGAVVLGPINVARGGAALENPFGSQDIDRITDPQVIALASGGFIVSWAEQVAIESDKVRMVQRFKADGTAQGDPVKLFADMEEPPQGIQIAPLSDGGFVAAYAVSSFFPDSTTGVWTQTYRGNGQPSGDATRVEGTETAEGLTQRALGPGLDGETLLAFVIGVFAQAVRLDGSGEHLGGIFAVTEQPPKAPLTRQSEATLIPISEDRIAAIWHGTFENGIASDILLRTTDIDGSNPSRVFRLNQNTEGEQLFPAAVQRPDGGLFVLWRDTDVRDDDEGALIARQVAATGRPLGSEVRITPFDQSFHRVFDIALSEDDGLIVGWAQAGSVVGGFLTRIDTQFSGAAQFGSKTANTIEGTDVADLIVALGGSDTLVLGDGDDTGYGYKGNDSLNGGQGADLLSGGAGNDDVSGGRGNDIGLGDAGADRVKGEGGADFLRGGVGNDTVLGGGGADNVAGDRGDDVVDGGNGKDLVDGDSGNDTIRGGKGSDTVLGSDGNDLLLGGEGADILFGGGGDNTLLGGSGNDRLRAGDVTEMTGGPGSDDFEFGIFDETLLVTDLKLGTDRLLFSTFLDETEGLSPRQIVNRFEEVERGDTLLDLGNGKVITLEGVADLDALVRSIDFV